MTAVYVRTLRWLGRQRWFAALGRRLAPLDARVLRATRGRWSVTGRAGAVYPVLLLTTTGRRTGKPRTTPVMYLSAGAGYAITSESFGQSRPAAWPLNLDAEPRARIELSGRVIECRARRADADEADRLWPRFVELWPAHESYRKRSGVRKTYVLEPR